MRGADLLVNQLALHGTEHIFGVPGESYLSVLDALFERNDIRFITCRQEGGAAMAAEATGKLTGRPGICFVTRGPGATNASAGVHVAYQDSTPMILLIGQVGRAMVDREAFQEIDYRRMFGQMAKWVAQIDRAERIPEYLSRAFRTATSGRPGPVVLALPEDMLRDEVFPPQNSVPPYASAKAAPAPSDLARLTALLKAAERPFVIIGGGGWSADACKNLERFAVANNLPVGASFRCQDYMNNDGANYAGHVGIGIDPNLSGHVRAADLLLVLGARLGEMTSSGYSLFEPPKIDQTFIHAHASAEELGRVFAPDLAINADMQSLCAALADLGTVTAGNKNFVNAIRNDFDLFRTPPKTSDMALDMAKVVAHVRDVLPDDAIVTNGAGNYAIWLHRYFGYRTYRSQLAPTSGSMGYGLPAAIGAAVSQPGREVVCFAGDGCFMMTCQELATAAQHSLNVTIIVVDNGMYGTIRMHQERNYPDRISGTNLTNPDFSALARAYGAFAETVTRTEDFAEAFKRARAYSGPSLLHLKADPKQLTPALRLKG